MTEYIDKLILDDVQWTVLLSGEVAEWLDGLSPRPKKQAMNAMRRLRAVGHLMRMPHSRSLGDGLFELRFDCGNVAQRITYIFDVERQIITLTTFRKQKNQEQRQVARAKRAADSYRSSSDRVKKDGAP